MGIPERYFNSLWYCSQGHSCWSPLEVNLDQMRMSLRFLLFLQAEMTLNFCKAGMCCWMCLKLFLILLFSNCVRWEFITRGMICWVFGGRVFISLSVVALMCCKNLLLYPLGLRALNRTWVASWKSLICAYTVEAYQLRFNDPFECVCGENVTYVRDCMSVSLK